ncbi:hypothetical protein PPL_00110 [Heterostelium album PN500]|uniref:Ankyrin repeat protein n=1 Tax=Heterostelium pallidum (strain ATCC 26659 / Pp 5 / PN500) TaxID=670386 RepID=D3AVJ7_HETP5|nr:hypothetical protein PPL_00110 [Heterostelium album PN500]EFA86320.1 hypothetical protein PPL_00110 [Heterostelium album PN500]|eukprot:XP_020438425.1 hypothetical protein PPL_00110 [Heterostelium album PN500]
MKKDIYLKIFNNNILNKHIFNNVSFINKVRSSYERCNWKQLLESPYFMVGNGYFDLLMNYFEENREDLISNEIEIDFIKLLIIAIKVDRFDLFEYLWSEFDFNSRTCYDQQNTNDVLVEAIIYNRMDVVSLLFESASSLQSSGFNWHYKRAFEESPKSKSLAMLEYVSEQFDSYNIVSKSIPKVFDNAASVGSIEMIEWLAENKPQHRPNNLMYREAIIANQMEVVKYLLGLGDEEDRGRADGRSSTAVCLAADKNNLDLLKLLHQNGFEFNSSTYFYAINKNNLEMVQWLAQVPAEYPINIIFYTIKCGNLEIFKWILENTPFVCDVKDMDMAAQYNRLDFLEYLHGKGILVCTTDAMDLAATKGHTDVVRWLNENRTEGCTGLGIREALTNGHFAVVQYLCENHMMACNSYELSTAACAEQFEIFEWLLFNRFEYHHNHFEISDPPMHTLFSKDKYQIVERILNERPTSYENLIRYRSIIEKLYKNSQQSLEILNKHISNHQKK